MSNQREASKKDWSCGERARIEEINSGSLQRIADATEAMAADYVWLRQQREYWEATAEARLERARALERRLSATRGVVTKLRKKIAEAEKR